MDMLLQTHKLVRIISFGFEILKIKRFRAIGIRTECNTDYQRQTRQPKWSQTISKSLRE